MTPPSQLPTDRFSHPDFARFDFAGHNAEQHALWADFTAGRPTARIRVILGTNTRFFMFNDGANPGGIDFRSYTEDPDIMFDAQLQFQRWSKFNLLQDANLGLPDKWTVGVDFQNYYEAGWLGCGLHYFDGQVPDTLPDFSDIPERVMENGIPDPFGGLGAKALEYWEHFKARAARETFLGRPIEVAVPFLGTDGPLTVACNLFGAGFVCETMAADPDRLQTLLGFLTDATIQRMAAWRKAAGLPVRQKDFGFADDSLALISTPMYREHVLPHHRRLCDALGERQAAPLAIHLCGDSTRHFETLVEELNIGSFDTGFPVDFGAMRRQLGPKVTLQGGPHVDFLMRATPGEVRDEVRRILKSGVLEGGRFVLREGNNLAPYTPLANTEAMYHAGRESALILAAYRAPRPPPHPRGGQTGRDRWQQPRQASAGARRARSGQVAPVRQCGAGAARETPDKNPAKDDRPRRADDKRQTGSRPHATGQRRKNPRPLPAVEIETTEPACVGGAAGCSAGRSRDAKS